MAYPPSQAPAKPLWPPTIAPLHFWKAIWHDWETFPKDSTDLYGKWIFCTPTKPTHGIVGVEVMVSLAERQQANFDVMAQKKSEFYQKVLDFVVKEGL